LSVFGKVVLALVIAGALMFAFQGGEYSTMDLWRQRQRKVRLQAETDSLSRELDSLRQVVKAVQNDRATQERIAREEFGMVRGDKEIIYRLDGQMDSASRR
jgi:cell division protein FtsB